jgi:hypothetical protein
LVVVAVAIQTRRLEQVAVEAAGMRERQEQLTRGEAAAVQDQTGSQYLAAAALLYYVSLLAFRYQLVLDSPLPSVEHHPVQKKSVPSPQEREQLLLIKGTNYGTLRISR